MLSGDVLPYTMADLTTDGTSITVTDPAKVEPVCTNAAEIPGIEGLPIDEARARLIRSGWTPVPGDPAQQAYSQAADIAAAGVPEVEECRAPALPSAPTATPARRATLRSSPQAKAAKAAGCPWLRATASPASRADPESVKFPGMSTTKPLISLGLETLPTVDRLDRSLPAGKIAR